MIHTLTDSDRLTPSELVVADEPPVAKNEPTASLFVSRAIRTTESVHCPRDTLTEAAE